MAHEWVLLFLYICASPGTTELFAVRLPTEKDCRAVRRALMQGPEAPDIEGRMECRPVEETREAGGCWSWGLGP